MERIRLIRKSQPLGGKAPVEINEAQIGSLYQIALELGREKAERIRLLKDAILKGDTDEVHRIGAKICGLGDFFSEFHGDWYETSDRVN